MSDAELDLHDPSLYINRELSLLAFNRRVLDLALDPTVPLLERLRFLCISSTNLDEFFEVRVASLRSKREGEADGTSVDGLTTEQQLQAIAESAHGLVAEQYRTLNEVVIPGLAEHGVRFVRRTHWTSAQAEWVADYFRRMLLPVLSPLGLDPAHPFPRILNKSLNFVVTVEGRDAFGRSGGIAVVQAPRSLPRLIRLPREHADGDYSFVFLSSVIHAHVGALFPGMRVTGCYQFRVTRNSDLYVDEEEIDDLLHALEGELLTRNYGRAVRLEVADNCPDDLAGFLLDEFKLDPRDLYQVTGPVNLNRLAAIHGLVDRPDLKYPPLTPGLPEPVRRASSLFVQLRNEGPILLHHPFESFGPVVDFIREAAADPQVLAIKQTLYRTGSDSPIVDALVDAARASKEVTVVVELKARFDEQANIRLATRLQDAGVQVVYGVVNHKTHAKMALVVRREGQTLRRYVHLGTGNYHAGTARAYTDYGFMTADPAVGEDVHTVFQQLTGLGQATNLTNLLQSPFSLHPGMVQRIERETEHARSGRPARIVVKCNALIEPEVIRALYGASNAGVRIELIVRGICCLRPGVPGASENIHVRSILGRFLEHTRVFYFHNAGQEELFLSSADWMQRNFFRRIETCFPLDDPDLKARVIDEALENYLADNTNAWVLNRHGHYHRLSPGESPAHTAQDRLLERLAR